MGGRSLNLAGLRKSGNWGQEMAWTMELREGTVATLWVEIRKLGLDHKAKEETVATFNLVGWKSGNWGGRWAGPWS